RNPFSFRFSRIGKWLQADRVGDFSVRLDELQDLRSRNEVFGQVDHLRLGAGVLPWRDPDLNLSADDAHQAGTRRIEYTRAGVPGCRYVGDQRVESPLQI